VAMFMMIGNGSLGIFHLNIGRPFFLIAIIVLGVWWINNGGCCSRGCSCGEEVLDEDGADADSDE